jgi:hypothetical protein
VTGHGCTGDTSMDIPQQPPRRGPAVLRGPRRSDDWRRAQRLDFPSPPELPSRARPPWPSARRRLRRQEAANGAGEVRAQHELLGWRRKAWARVWVAGRQSPEGRALARHELHGRWRRDPLRADGGTKRGGGSTAAGQGCRSRSQ